VYPVIVGAGQRLFGDTTDVKTLRLASARTMGDVHVMVYERG
jgi:hypothetical protein